MADLSKLSDADLEAVAGGKMDAVSDVGLMELQRPDSGYKDVPDDKLNFVQKAERWAGDVGLVKPGRELFSPAAVENKKSALLPIVAGTAGAAGLVAAPGLLPAAGAAMKNPVVRGAVKKWVGPAIGGGAILDVITRRLRGE